MNTKKKSSLEYTMEKLVGKKLLYEQQQALTDRINVRVAGIQQVGYRKLNIGLRMIDIPFMIIPKRTEDESYWEIHEIDRYI